MYQKWIGDILENICIFEDNLFENFLPLTYSRPVFELKCGFKTIREKIQYYFPNSNLHLIMRDYLKPVFSKDSVVINGHPKGDALFINGRIIMKERPSIKDEGI